MYRVEEGQRKDCEFKSVKIYVFVLFPGNESRISDWGKGSTSYKLDLLKLSFERVGRVARSWLFSFF